MKLITREEWDNCCFLNFKLTLICDKLNDLINLINENDKTNFRLVKLSESVQQGIDYWTNIIDYLNKKHQCNINYIYHYSSFEEVFYIVNSMIKLYI